MNTPEPKFITFDMYGTLTDFQMSTITKDVTKDIIGPDLIGKFLEVFSYYRMDEVMGDWRPYDVVIDRAYQRTCRRTGAPYLPEHSSAIFGDIPNWGPHPDIPVPLAKLASRFPLVILSNAADSQIGRNVEKLGAPFHRAFSAEQAQAYKPRLQAFEYMFAQLGCLPEEVMHVSSSPRYDLQPATDLGVKNTVYLNRGWEPAAPFYHHYDVASLDEVVRILGV
ncbi:haloacid dehalogenase type II [Occultella glacieicola]|uniref:Haloacid dehalogenase type II n=1 Tax=Occultella glacieicola TaxID=2518684 RepID=A0ABY2DX61_9MICO|nr:haloacid dehalogenase type II [Occultella glacieicola]TDE88560.1 haloacid dehalogenase type II [Occultella glacieicola]